MRTVEYGAAASERPPQVNYIENILKTDRKGV